MNNRQILKNLTYLELLDLRNELNKEIKDVEKRKQLKCYRLMTDWGTHYFSTFKLLLEFFLKEVELLEDDDERLIEEGISIGTIYVEEAFYNKEVVKA